MQGFEVFSSKGPWYKGNLHSHTTVSDGHLTPQELVTQYELRGYDFIGLTDHWKTTSLEDLVVHRIRAISGTEITVWLRQNDIVAYHIVGLGVPDGFTVPRGSDVQYVVDAINGVGGLAIVAHPYWSGLEAADLDIKNYVGIEIYNHSCFTATGKANSEFLWDNLLLQKQPILGFAVDDCHKYPEDVHGGWMMVKARSDNPQDILESLRCGHFYSSTGPVINNVWLDHTRVCVDCSPVEKIMFLGNVMRSKLIQVKGRGDLLTMGQYELAKDQVYLRVVVEDKHGRRAWTNAQWF